MSEDKGADDLHETRSLALSLMAVAAGGSQPLLLPQNASAPPMPLSANGATEAPEEVIALEDVEDDQDDEATTVLAASSNPFLTPLAPAENGGPSTFLPPLSIVGPSSGPPPKRSVPPPPPRRTTPPAARPLAPPSLRRSSPSTAPPFALAGTIPPYPRMSLDDKTADAQRVRRRRRLATFATVAALLAAVYYAREKLAPPTATASRQETAGIRATAKHQGIKLIVDGNEMGDLPQEVSGLSVGQHSIAFEGGERYQTQKSLVSLAPHETKDFEQVSLWVTRGAATFDVKTPGTALALVSADERRILKDYSHPIEIDNAKTWTLEASKPGYKTLTMPIAFDDEAEKTFVVVLNDPDRPAPPAPAVAPEPPSEGQTPAKTGQPVPSKVEPTPVARPDTPVAAAAHPVESAVPRGGAESAAGKCTLNINSIPASNVSVDGRPVGATPKLGVLVAAGTHTVMMVTDTARRATSTTCGPGEEKTIAVRLGP